MSRRLVHALLFAAAAWLSGCGSGSADTPAAAPAQVARPYALQVQSFGQGRVSSADGVLSCAAGAAPETCTMDTSAGASVTLFATPSTGWTLHHWTGCDSVTASQGCVVTMTESRVVYPVFGTTATRLAPAVKLLDSATLARLNSQAGSTLVFTAGTAAAAALVPGDLIVSQAGAGFARRVQAVKANAGSAIFVSTTPAALDELLTPGTVIYNTPLTRAQLQRARPLMAGATLRPAPQASGGPFTIDVDSAVNGLSVRGTVSLSLTPDVAMHLSTRGIEQFRAAVTSTYESSLAMTASASVSAASRSFDLYALDFAPIFVDPVVLVPRITVKLVLNGQAEASFTTSVTFSDAATLGSEYRQGYGWNAIWTNTTGTSFVPPTMSGKASAQATISNAVALDIYGIAGPYLTLDPSVRVQASATASSNGTASGTTACVDYAVLAGLTARIGVTGSVLGYTLPDYSATVFDRSWPVTGGKTAGCTDAQPPTVPAGLVVTPESPTVLLLTWQASTDDRRVAGYRLRRDGTLVTELFQTQVVDLPLRPGVRYCYTVSAFDAAGNESAESPAVCATTRRADTTAPTAPATLTAVTVSTNAVDLAWTAATDDVGVAGYTVLRDGRAVMSVPAARLSARDTGLSPGKSVCYQVIALDAAGNASARSPQACTTTATNGAWDAYVRCVDQPYQVRFNLDLDANASGAVQTDGTGRDYNGGALSFVVDGQLDEASHTLTAQITWAFEGGSCIRRDTFTASLKGTDTGDVAATQTSVCGCPIAVRLRTAGQAPLELTGPGRAGLLDATPRPGGSR